MEGYFYLSKDGTGFNYLDIKLDDQAIDYLKRGSPIYCGLFVDDCTHLPDYKRSILKINIGKNIDVRQRAKDFKNKIPRELLIDKSYLFDALRNIHNKIAEEFSEEFPTMKIKTIPLKHEVIPANEKLNLPCILEKSHKVSLSTKEAADLLGVDTRMVYYWHKKKYFDHSSDSRFDAEEIKRIAENPPEWLQVARNSGPKIHRAPAGFLSSYEVAKALGLSEGAISNNRRAGNIPYQKINGAYCIEKSFVDRLILDPPSWLIKSKKSSKACYES